MKILPFLFLFTSVNGFSQEPITPSKASKFRIGLNAAWEGVHRRQIVHDAVMRSEIEAWNIRHIESAASIRISIRVGYALGHRTDLELGLGYTLMQFAWDINRYRSAQPPQPWIIFTGERVMHMGQMQFLEIPIRVSHYVGHGSVRWVSSIGIITGFLVWEPEPMPAHEYTQRALFLQEASKVNISPVGSSGLAVRLGDQSEFRLEPTLTFGLMKLTDASVRTSLWSAGVNFGWYRRF